MLIPVIRGVIDRRILVNYRVDAEVLARTLPEPFRPKRIDGYGMAGICLIRLKQIRPVPLPAWCGVSSENAAHRVAVEWDWNGVTHSGVYVRRRDTSSWLNSLAGGRVFPGVHHHAKFDVRETDATFSIKLRSDDDNTSMSVQAHVADRIPATSLFATIDDASEFFQGGSLGYSDCGVAGCYQGMELRCQGWHVEPLQVDAVHSSFFEDESIFPPGSIQFDCALLMRNIAHEWHAHPDIRGTKELLKSPRSV